MKFCLKGKMQILVFLEKTNKKVFLKPVRLESGLNLLESVNLPVAGVCVFPVVFRRWFWGFYRSE